MKINICDQGLENFLCAFLKLAREDYIANRNKKDKDITDDNLMRSQASIKRFLKSAHGKLFLPENVDPDVVIAAWDKECEYETWRDRHECRNCKNKKCPHIESRMSEKKICKGFIEKTPKNKVA